MAKELTYKEFEYKIKDISPEIYMTYEKFGFICLAFGNNLLLRVSLTEMYDIDVINKNFAGFEKVYQLASILASTPIYDRGDIEDINTFYKPQEKQFRVELLPNSYLWVAIKNGKEHLEIGEKFKNDDFSDLGGPEFIQSFHRSYYQGLQKEYSEYLPTFDPNDKRFVFEENNK